MNSTSEQNNRDYAALSISNSAVNGRPFVDRNGEAFFLSTVCICILIENQNKLSILLQHSTAAKQILILAEWLRSIFPGLNLPINASDEDLKACLLDANVLSQVLNKLKKPGSAKEVLFNWFCLCSTTFVLFSSLFVISYRSLL